jgi:hypothetical protein
MSALVIHEIIINKGLNARTILNSLNERSYNMIKETITVRRPNPLNKSINECSLCW